MIRKTVNILWHTSVTLLALMLCVQSATAADPKKADPKTKEVDAAPAAPVPYDRICHVDVSYLWKAKALPTATPTSAVVAKEFFASVSEQGFIAEEIQDRLKTKLTSVRAQALKSCESEHQEVEGCIARKLAGLSPEFPRLDYTRRSMIFASVRKDCGSNVGKCVATEVSEMKCWMNIPPETSVPNEPKVEIAQPGNTEPPMTETEQEEEISPEEGEVLDDSDGEIAGEEAPEVDVVKPAKKKKKKKKVEKPKSVDGKEKEEENPYTQPFSIQ